MITSLMIVLALFNGLLIVTNRVFNARLGLHISGAGAAFWNHLVGFFFLVVVTSFLTGISGNGIGQIPFYLFLGGMIGAGYVAINSFVMPRIGTTKATVLVIAGQVVLGTMIDVYTGKVSNITMTVVGIGLVIVGMWIGNSKKINNNEAYKPRKERAEVSVTASLPQC